jgi:5-methylcytosine-specific restriction endonuclease McrA
VTLSQKLTPKQRYVLNNPEKVKASKQKYRAANKEKIAEGRRKYLRNNAKKCYAAKLLYEKGKIQRTPKWLTLADKQRISQVYEECPSGQEVDHIVPLNGRTVCGLHVPWNLQYLSKQENTSKSNKLLPYYFVPKDVVAYLGNGNMQLGHERLSHAIAVYRRFNRIKTRKKD